jgi:hypothetical protein
VTEDLVVSELTDINEELEEVGEEKVSSTDMSEKNVSSTKSSTISVTCRPYQVDQLPPSVEVTKILKNSQKHKLICGFILADQWYRTVVHFGVRSQCYKQENAREMRGTSFLCQLVSILLFGCSVL